MENKTEKIFTDLKDEVFAYVSLKLRLWKLMATERAAECLSSLSYAIVLLLFAFFAFLFLFVALALFLGECLGSMALGFLLVGMLYLLVVMVSLLTKGGICFRLTNVYVRILQINNDKNNDDEENQSDNSASTIIERKVGTPEAVSENGTKD